MAKKYYKSDGTPITRGDLGLAPKPHGSKKDRLKARRAMKAFAARRGAEKNTVVEEILHGKTPVH